ncbi:MAG: acyltransferase domain-containing protein [Salinarimonadaceae bacterium]|nr:MAG: acyltransferase domain-containing protein [Salinarimonadaceae bacterium]
MRHIAFCFSGQGGQYFGMGRELYESDAAFRSVMDAGDAILRAKFGFSALAELYDESRSASQRFDRLEATHPALFIVQYAAARALIARGLSPDLLMGASLGEFVAMALAGVIGFEEALTRIARQPAMLRATCGEGALIAALAPAEQLADDPVVGATAGVAGVGAPGHCVLAARRGALPELAEHLAANGIMHQELPVPFAFHSDLIDPAAASCRAMFAEMTLREAALPCWSACLAGPLDPATPDLLWRIVRDPMNVAACVSALEAAHPEGLFYVDLSPSGALAALVRQNLARPDGGPPPSRIALTLSPMGGDSGRMDAALRRAHG